MKKVVPDTNWLELVEAALNGDTRACDNLARGIFRWASQQLSQVPQQDREGLANDFASHLSEGSFCRLAYIPSDRLQAYLRTALRRRLIDYWRGEKRRHEREVPYERVADADGREGPHGAPIAGDVMGESVETIVMRRLQIAELTRAVGRMSLVDQEIFHTYIERGMTEAEVASQLRLPVGTISRHIYSIRQRLRRKLAGTRLSDGGD